MIKLAFAFLFVGVSVYAQQVKVEPGKRDRKQENAVVTLFEQARKQAGGTTLQQIQQPVLQKLVCTASFMNSAPSDKRRRYKLLNDSTTRSSPSALYKTADPAKISPQLQRLATYDKGGNSGERRFSVAVWTSQLEDGLPEYWVGVQLYLSAGTEYFQNHFTDAIEWKGAVAPQCKDVK